MRKYKCELWVRHLRKYNSGLFETYRRAGIFYQEMSIRLAKEEAFFKLEDLITAYEQMTSTRTMFGAGKSHKRKIRNLREITYKWYFNAWGELFTASKPNLSNGNILRYIKATR